jgi:hypothetical protein
VTLSIIDAIVVASPPRWEATGRRTRMPANRSGINVAGLFLVGVEVRDSNQNPIPSIDSTVRNARHVVTVKNISSLPRNAKVKASLPNGSGSLEFAVEATTGEAASWWHGRTRASATWWCEKKNIGQQNTATAACLVSRNGGPKSLGETFHCDELFDQRGSIAWQPLSGSFPNPFPIWIGIDAN